MVGVLGVGGVEEWYRWIGRMGRGLMMAQGQRYEMRKECLQLVSEWKGGSNEKSKKMELREQWKCWKANDLNRGWVGGFRRG